MARYQFGGGVADWTFGSVTVDGTPQLAQLTAGVAVTFWSSEVGGIQFIDLIDSEGQPIVAVISSTGTDGRQPGQIPSFYGPDGVNSMWAQAGTGPRALMQAAIDTAALVTGTLSSDRMGVGTPVDAAARVSIGQGVDATSLWSVNSSPDGNVNAAHARYDSATPGSYMLAGRVTGDAQSRVLHTVNGTMHWGPGDSGPDTTLYRAGPGFLVTEGDLAVKGGKVAPIAWASVRRHGAVGDGIADDTAAVQAAIDSGAGVVYLPAGTYRITSALTLRSGLVLRGDGDTSTFIKQTSTTQPAMTGTAIGRVEIGDLQIQGPADGSPTNGIQIAKGAAANTPYISIRQVTVTGFGNDGISLEQAIVCSIDRVTVQSVGRYGFHIFGQAGGASGTSVSMTACFANAAGVAGYRIFKMAYCSLNACAVDNSPVGYLIDQGFNITLTGCGGESNTTNTVKVIGGYGVALNSMFVYSNRGVGVWITDNAKAVKLEQCIDVEPGAGATAFIKTDAGTTGIMIACNNATANAITYGTFSVLDDGAGGSTLRTYLYGLTSASFEQDITSYGGNLITSLAGKGLRVKEGANARMGTAVLASGTVTVANTSVTATSRIFLTHQTPGTAPGALRVDSRVAGTSFTVKSTSATDNGTIAYHIIEPS